MLGLSHKTLGKRIKDEKKAQSDYGKDIVTAKSKGDSESAKTIGHIRSEEVEHEQMLRKIGSRRK